MVKQLAVETHGQGLYEITAAVQTEVRSAKVSEGLCTLFVRHTSASLVIQENADPSAKRDLERWIARLVPEGDPFYTHDATWQGIYLWEHRQRGSRRDLVLHIGS
jgi:secondary thiamine-phosphate synthase enzyme